MCLITNDKTKYIATEDITVFKMMMTPYVEHEINGSIGRSIYYYYGWHHYMLGEQPEVKIKESNEWIMTDNVVERMCVNIFPGFVTDYYGLKVTKEQRNVFICIGAGYHSMTKERFLTSNEGWNYDILVECTIPKGAEYYKDMTGLYVSNRLVVNKIVDTQFFMP